MVSWGATGSCGVREGPWAFVVRLCAAVLRVRVLPVPKMPRILPCFSAKARECSGDVRRIIYRQERGHFEAPAQLELEPSRKVLSSAPNSCSRCAKGLQLVLNGSLLARCRFFSASRRLRRPHSESDE